MAGNSSVLGVRDLIKRIRVDLRRLEMNVLRSPRSLVLPRPFVPAFLEGSRFVSALKTLLKGSYVSAVSGLKECQLQIQQ